MQEHHEQRFLFRGYYCFIGKDQPDDADTVFVNDEGKIDPFGKRKRGSCSSRGFFVCKNPFGNT